MTNPYINLE